MNLADWQNLIGALGFPIVCCIAQFYIILKMNKTHNETLSELKGLLTIIPKVLLTFPTLSGIENNHGQE